MIYLIVIGSAFGFIALGFLLTHSNNNYRSTHNPNDPNSIYRNPIADELREINRRSMDD